MIQTEAQQHFSLQSTAAVEDEILPFAGPCALEDDAFPFEVISDIAESESWRKEINRPTYHIHKWWAHRLGSVFRAISLAALTPSGSNVLDLFYRPVRLKGVTVFDPFMGSGTTVGEALKLGARAVGRDINPVAHFLVRNALASHDRMEVLNTFGLIERDVADEIKRYYKATLQDGTQADVLYYFWVKQVNCPECSKSVDLFSSRIFAKHAYPKRHPDAQSSCPKCGEINAISYNADKTRCISCNHNFNPQHGPVCGQKATCPFCDHKFLIAKIVRESDLPPKHRLYAKLVLLPDGTKKYLTASDEDHALFSEAEKLLAKRSKAYPVVAIEPGYNTNQALNYNYRYWHQMFNARQLLCLSILADRIRKISDSTLRDLFTCLFSGVLEFNNLFSSYKGEGTGAVRHMFSHHILKPERTPLEGNLWGTTKSSGSFMTMFERRIWRALDYAGQPFELQVKKQNGKKIKGQKIYGLSAPLGFEAADDACEFSEGKRVYLSCGDSSRIDLEDCSIDAIVTDPPFFDNVHYSQLADFFHVWQRHILGENGHYKAHTTRSGAEVQTSDEVSFTERLGAVWSEAHRVLKDDGVLVFTYHHSRVEGWRSVLSALIQAGFCITASHPIKAELSVAIPKHQAKDPINLDIIIVCRKRSQVKSRRWNGDLWGSIDPAVEKQVQRLTFSGRHLSRNDVRIIVMGQLLKHLSVSSDLDTALDELKTSERNIEATTDALHHDDSGREK